MEKLKVIELFGGIGACSKALDRLKIPYEVADYVEIDKYACASFNALHGSNFEPQDIRKWDKDIRADLIMHGSPCQDFSIAGRQAGADEGASTRSSLMYETLRIVEKVRPKYVIWENVKNLLGKKHRHNFNAYLEHMEGLGYRNYYQVLNAKDYGVPQNRERVFTVSVHMDVPYCWTFEFPEKQPLAKCFNDILEGEVDGRYYLPESIANCYAPVDESGNVIGKLIMDKWQDHMKRVYDINKYAPTVNTWQGGDLQAKVLLENGKIRKVTPKECWRLMGFDDEDYEKAARVNSRTQLYKQAGNSIVVNVLEAIFKELFI